jgi:predicted nucleotidyltransferase
MTLALDDEMAKRDSSVIPEFNAAGDLPVAVYRATLTETISRFGMGAAQRQSVAIRLDRIYRLAHATGFVSRMILFGSFVTNKEEPNDVDIAIIMEDTFEPDKLTGETQILFDHGAAQAHFGASVFWLRRFAIFGDEETFIADWQFKRDRQRRGIIEIVGE